MRKPRRETSARGVAVHRWRGVLLVAAALLAGLVAAGRAAAQTAPEVPSPPSSPPAQEMPGVPQETQALITIERARLAASGRYYLELSLSTPSLSLCHSGVAIMTYPIQAVSVGYPRLFFFPKGDQGTWIGEVWTLGHLEPAKVFERVKEVPGGADASSSQTLPPTIEELTPAPPLYFIQFDNRRSVQVLLDGQIPATTKEISPWRQRWEDFLEGLGVKSADPVRVRIQLQAADGASLYRSFPDDPPDMLVVP